jgi:integrase
MPLHRARVHSPRATYLAAEPKRDADAGATLAALLGAFSPRVVEVVSLPDLALALDLGKIELPQAMTLVERMAQRIGTELGLASAIGGHRPCPQRAHHRRPTQKQAHKARGKTPRARRTVPLSADTVMALTWHKKNQAEEKAISGGEWNAAGLVFVSEKGTPLNHGNLDRQFDALLRHVNLPDIRFHDLRHTYAALSIVAGVDLYTLSRRMGHSSITVTANCYGHLYQGNTQDADALDRLLQRSA